MNEGQVIDQVCLAFGKFDSEFRNLVRGQIAAVGEDWLMRKDWPFRKVYKAFAAFTANQTDLALPQEFHHFTSLWTDDIPKIKIRSSQQYAEAHSDSNVHNNTPKLEYCTMVKGDAGPKSLKLIFWPKAAGGEVVKAFFIEKATVGALADVPDFLHGALVEGVKAAVLGLVLKDPSGQGYINPNYYQIKRYADSRLDAAYLQFVSDPQQTITLEREAAEKNATFSLRNLRGV